VTSRRSNRWQRPQCASCGVLVGVVALLLGSLGCERANSARRAEAGPTLRPLFTLRLMEPDSLYLALASVILRGPHRDVYVSDIVGGRVIRYDSTGRPAQVFGRPGEGPGEFRQPSAMFMRNDSTLAVLDLSRALYELFDIRTAQFRGALRFEGVGSSYADQDSVIWFGAMNPRLHTATAALRAGVDTFEYQIPVPAEYLQSPALAGTFPGAEVVTWADTLLVGMHGSNDLRLFTMDGRLVDSLAVPVRLRRGVPDDVVRALEPGRARDIQDWARVLSALVGLQRRSDGRFVLVHADFDVDGRLRAKATFFVTLLSADRRTACADGHLPVSEDVASRITFSGDTLFVLDRRLVNDTIMETTVTGYEVDGSRCHWMEVESTA
jgi:hypothetical protein